MTTNRKLLVALLCPLFLLGIFVLAQGCGGGGQTEQAQTSTREEPQATSESETSAPALESHTEEMALAGYTCPMHPEASSLEPGTCGACGMELQRANLHYTCTMCPDSHSLEPGKCSHCGMDLVLRPQAQKAEPGTAY